MDIEDISPAAVFLGIAGAGIVIFMMAVGGKNIPIGMFWKILAPILTFAACFFMVQRMAE